MWRAIRNCPVALQWGKAFSMSYRMLSMQSEWLTAALEDGIPISEPGELDDYSGQFKLRLPKSLHKSLAEHSRAEGISMNQYCVYLLSRNDALAKA